MKVVFFHAKPHHHAKSRVFAAGMQRHGINVEFASVNASIECDLAVFWSHKLSQQIQEQRRTP